MTKNDSERNKKELNTNLYPLSEQKKPPVRSLATNMYYHVTLQTKRTTVYLTVKEGCREEPRKNEIYAKTLETWVWKVLKQNRSHIPGAFSQISQQGALLGSAKPTRTCRLASLLHICT